MDAGYGCNMDLRADVSALALCYVAGIMLQTTVWASGTRPLPPRKWSGRGRQPKLIRRDDEHQPVSVNELALGLPKRAWRRIEWREGAAERLSSRFARVRVRVAHRDYNLTDSRPEEWLLIEWPKGEDAPTKYWLSTLPQDITFRSLVDMTKLRWRIERDYQELKQEVGLGHFEGRGWRGFHHHTHRSLWIPDLREGDDSPLWTTFHHAVPATCSTQRLSTQRFRPCGLNAIARIRSRRCAGDSSLHWSERCRDVPAAPLKSRDARGEIVHDAVRLIVCKPCFGTLCLCRINPLLRTFIHSCARPRRPIRTRLIKYR